LVWLRHDLAAVALDDGPPNRAAAAHERSLFAGEKTCIDCHKGIAHKLPDMKGVRGWQ
jgi:cytochrome c-type protein NapC